MLPAGFNINGYRITIAKPAKHHNFKISDKVDLSSEYRRKIDDWCFEMFGGATTEKLEDGKIVGYSHQLIMNQKTYNELLKHIAAQKGGNNVPRAIH